MFDAIHGVDTRVSIAADKLEISSANRDKAVAYDTCPWLTLRQSMRLASLRAEGFTFVDMGCGKGKVLLSAMVLPFNRIVGVEFSPYLSRIAEQNLAAARFLRRRCSSVDIVCLDVVQYPIPEEPTIFFFHNPFTYEIMEIVLDNIVSSYLRVLRPIYLVFCRASSMMPEIGRFLPPKTGDRARQLASTYLGSRSLNVFELPSGRC